MTLRVRLEIVPHGDEERAYEIGRLDVSNLGYVGFGLCEYQVLDLTSGQEGEYRERVEHPRRHGAWELVRTVIEKLRPDTA